MQPAAALQVIVNARKPDFFNHSMSLYEIVTPEGLMKPAYTLRKGGLYCGGGGACPCCGGLLGAFCEGVWAVLTGLRWACLPALAVSSLVLQRAATRHRLP
jgi:hypothetical protein